jgi:MoxR-like ATPase
LSKLLEVEKEIKKAIVGQDKLIRMMIIALISNGHILIEGVPGVAKTTAIKTLSQICDLDFKRVQFTPDLLPSDIIGVETYNPKTNEFQIYKGPIFTNLLLADEINRSPAKVQSALLEAMQERQVSIGKKTLPLPKPFMVLATQNPIEQEGTYPLPEAQLDRFMFKVIVNYPSLEDEIKIVELIENPPTINKLLSRSDILQFQEEVKNVFIDKELIEYIAEIVNATRKEKLLRLGASPRATIFLVKGAKANAFIKNRDYVIPEDILEIIYEVLRHRIILSYEAIAEDIKEDEIIENILNQVPKR